MKTSSKQPKLIYTDDYYNLGLLVKNELFEKKLKKSRRQTLSAETNSPWVATISPVAMPLIQKPSRNSWATHAQISSTMICHLIFLSITNRVWAERKITVVQPMTTRRTMSIEFSSKRLCKMQSR